MSDLVGNLEYLFSRNVAHVLVNTWEKVAQSCCDSILFTRISNHDDTIPVIHRVFPGAQMCILTPVGLQ